MSWLNSLMGFIGELLLSWITSHGIKFNPLKPLTPSPIFVLPEAVYSFVESELNYNILLLGDLTGESNCNAFGLIPESCTDDY